MIDLAREIIGTQPILTLQDLSVVWVTALVSENDVAGVARGDDAEVTIDAYPNRKFSGNVTEIIVSGATSCAGPESREIQGAVKLGGSARTASPRKSSASVRW